MRTLLKTRAARLALAVAAAVGVGALGGILGGTSGTQPALVAAADTVDKSTRDKIVQIAEQEMKSKHNAESGENCNYYSGKMAGTKCQAWCADFARYVWDQAGVKISGTTSGAASFRDYGKKNKTWKNGGGAKTVKPGDAVTYRLNDDNYQNDHVGIVTKVDKKTGKITVISGNSGDKVSKRTILDPAKSDITGYTSPVGKKGNKPKGDDKTDKAKSNQGKSNQGKTDPGKSDKTKTNKGKTEKGKTGKSTPGKSEDNRQGGLIEGYSAYTIAGPAGA